MSTLQQLGQYRVETPISDTAYRAVDMVRKRSVTLQVIDPARFQNPGLLKRFLEQAQAASDLVHPHLAWVWETGEESGYIYIAERHVSAPTLRQRLVESGSISWSEAIQVVGQLASGLDFMHGRGQVHGRLRPEMIYLSPELGAVLGGFGIPPSLVLDQEEAEDLEAARYTAPEVWQGEPAGPAADRYALACVLAEMLGGQPIFDGSTGEEICDRQLGELSFPAYWPESTPWQIEPVLEKALAVRPEQRFGSALELAAAPMQWVAQGIGGEQERARRESLQRQRQAEEEAARRRAEEAARLAALEQARHEIEIQARAEAEASTTALIENPAGETSDGIAAEAVAAELADGVPAFLPAVGGTPDVSVPAESVDNHAQRRHSHAESPSGRNTSRWLLGLVAAMLALAFFWAWNRGSLPGAFAPSPTPAASLTVTPAPATREPAAAPASPSPTNTQSPTITPTASATRRPTATATRRPTLTATVPSATATLPRPTATAEREEPNEEGSSLR